MLLVCFSLSCIAQDIKQMDYGSLYKKHKLTECTVRQVRFKNDTKDTAIIGQFQMNALGQMIQYTEFGGNGQKVCTHSYQYDSKGKVSACELVFEDQSDIHYACQLTYNATGKLMGRSIVNGPAHCWHQETYEYSSSGVLIKSTQHYKYNDHESTTSQTYPALLSTKENTNLSYMYDQRGFLVLRQFYNDQNKVFKSLVYEYH